MSPQGTMRDISNPDPPLLVALDDPGPFRTSLPKRVGGRGANPSRPRMTHEGERRSP
jgi:hypothetical protein